MRFRKCERRKLFPPCPVGLVVDRPAPLIFYDVALGVELLLCHRGKKRSHAVRLEPESELELIRWDCLEIIRPLEPGASVESSAGSLHELEMLVGLDVLRSLKEHMLEEVGKSGPASSLVR
jgi:hypothetical protein